MKLAIFIPSHEQHPIKFTMALASQMYTLGATAEFDIVMPITATASVGAFRARNKALLDMARIEQQRGWRFDLTAWFDSDMMFPDRTIQALARWDKDIVGASYVRRNPPYDELLGRPKGNKIIEVVDGLAPADRLPLGVMLVKRHVYDKFIPPVFRLDLGNGVDVIGEDYLFCEDAIGHGFEVWLDVELTKMVRHIATDVELAPPTFTKPSKIIPARQGPLVLSEMNGRTV